MRLPRLIELEDQLQKIPGVTGVRVTGTDAPSEIHIVATPDRPAKQVVRDVQSLAAAALGMEIDHRIVSVVQLSDASELAAARTASRPALDRVVIAYERGRGSVGVTLEWPDGEHSEGSASAGASREEKARAAADALSEALRSRLPSGELDVEQVLIQHLGRRESVLVGARLRDNGQQLDLTGSAYITEDVATAAARALLQAVNRKIA